MIFAHINRGSGEATLDSHYTFQIRTFWICAVAVASIGALLIATGFQVFGESYQFFPSVNLPGPSLFLFGVPVVGLFVWWLCRVIKGLVRINQSDPIENPHTLLV